MNYEFSLYILQQLISRLVYQDLFGQKLIVILFIFISGLVTSINPCIVSMLPMSFVYIGALQIKKHRLISFILGFFIVSVNFLLVCFIIGYRYYDFSSILPFLSAMIAVYLGLLLLSILPFSITMQKLDNYNISILGIHVESFFIGCLFTVYMFSCSAPVSFALFAFVFASSNYMLSILYSLIYLLGYICPLILLIILLARVDDFSLFLASFLFDIYALIGGCIILNWGILKCLELTF